MYYCGNMRNAGEPLPSKEESQRETKKRLDILDDITKSIKGIPEAILLGGSVAWGQNIAVRGASDIDLTIIISKENLPALAATETFINRIPKYLIDAFNNEKIDVIYLRNKVNGVDVNYFLHNPKSYSDYCKLEKSLRTFTNAFKPGGHLKGYGFDGVLRDFNVEVEEFMDGYIYPRPSLYENQYYGNPVRNDFLYSSLILEEKNSIISKADKDFWRSAIEQLKKEHGSKPDLSKTNILNTSFVYMTTPEALPKSIVEKIKERTLLELQIN
jgi:predicted nucleotidyltransferase